MRPPALRAALFCFALAPACDDGSIGSPPDAPTGLSVAAVTGGAHLTWTDASDDEDEFAIERKGSGGAFEGLDLIAAKDGSEGWQRRMAAKDGSEGWQRRMAAKDGSEGWQRRMAAKDPGELRPTESAAAGQPGA